MSRTPRTSKAKAEQQQLSAVTNSVADVEATSESGDYLSGWTILFLILLMPICSTAIQLPLSPSHGSIPSAEYHQITFQTCMVLYFAWQMLYTGRTLVSFASQAAIIPVLAAWIPFIQLHLSSTARYIGPAYSAALIKGVTLIPLQGLLLNLIRTSIEKSMPKSEFILGLGALALYFGTEYLWTSYQDLVLGVFYGFIRPYLMLVVSMVLMALLPTRWLTWALVPTLHTILWNPHSILSYPTQRLDDLLKPDGFSIVARREGVTGYLSVLENVQHGYRLMRCDHSILGGNWIAGVGSWPGGETSSMEVGRLAEPVYAVFVMLEAVRLVQSQDTLTVPDNQAKALNIGLGIGTTPSAFMAHGIDTTIVELDPVVHQLATTHFDLPTNHTAYLMDAVIFLQRELDSPQPKQYDYIIHDVFTGGAEPTTLFTYEFLSGLKQLLKPEGTIAINYASDIGLPSTKYVINTIISVFSNCRLFRDVAEEDGAMHVNFVNMVLFCRQTDHPLMFREPVEADYLGTSSRKTYLLPRLEMDLEQYVMRDDKRMLTANKTMILHAAKTFEMDRWHNVAARRHWEVMRTVIPPQVWELW